MTFLYICWELLLFSMNRIGLGTSLDNICSGLKIQYTKVGTGDLNPNVGTIFISNHRSVIDPIIVMNQVYKMGLLEGHGVSKPKIYARIFWFFVHRNYKKIRISFLGEPGIFRKLIRSLKAGRNVMFFPEGTRNRSKESLLSFEPGAEKLLKVSKANLVIFYLRGTERALFAGRLEAPVEYQIFRYEDVQEDVESHYRKSFDL